MHECIYKCTCNVRELHIQYFMSFGGSWLGEEGGWGGGGGERNRNKAKQDNVFIRSLYC